VRRELRKRLARERQRRPADLARQLADEVRRELRDVVKYLDEPLHSRFGLGSGSKHR
jgi:hypothetical protein